MIAVFTFGKFLLLLLTNSLLLSPTGSHFILGCCPQYIFSYTWWYKRVLTCSKLVSLSCKWWVFLWPWLSLWIDTTAVGSFFTFPWNRKWYCLMWCGIAQYVSCLGQATVGLVFPLVLDTVHLLPHSIFISFYLKLTLYVSALRKCFLVSHCQAVFEYWICLLIPATLTGFVFSVHFDKPAASCGSTPVEWLVTRADFFQSHHPPSSGWAAQPPCLWSDSSSCVHNHVVPFMNLSPEPLDYRFIPMLAFWAVCWMYMQATLWTELCSWLLLVGEAGWCDKKSAHFGAI